MPSRQTRKTSASSSSLSKTKKRKTKSKRKKRKQKASARSCAHLQHPLRCSGQLSLLLSEGQDRALEITRAEAVKRIWAYADLHRLKHPEDGRRIICNAALKDVLGERELGFANLARALTPHLTSMGTGEKGPSKRGGIKKQEDEEEEPVFASAALTVFMLSCSALTVKGRDWLQPGPKGDDVRVLFTRKEALRWLGDYIKRNGLRTSDKMHVSYEKKLWDLLFSDSACSHASSSNRAPQIHLTELSVRFRAHLESSEQQKNESKNRTIEERDSGIDPKKIVVRDKLPLASGSSSSSEDEVETDQYESDSGVKEEDHSSSDESI